MLRAEAKAGTALGLEADKYMSEGTLGVDFPCRIDPARQCVLRAESW